MSGARCFVPSICNRFSHGLQGFHDSSSWPTHGRASEVRTRRAGRSRLCPARPCAAVSKHRDAEQANGTAPQGRSWRMLDGHSPPRASNEKCNEKFCPVRAGAVCPAPGCMPALAHPGADEAPSARASASTAPTAAASVVAKDAWSRATPLGVPVAGGYITLRNASSAPDRLINRVKQRTAGGIAVYPLACSAAACNMDWR